MNCKSFRLLLGLVFSVALWPAGSAFAQGVTTGAITGTITDQQGNPLSGAQVQIINRSTGYSTGTLSRTNGLFLMQGLEVGGPYTVRVQMIGYSTQEQNDIRVTLSQATRVDMQLAQEAVAVAGIDVVGTRSEVFSPTKQGISTLVTDSVIERIPTLSRDFLDLVKITPQVVRPQDGNGFSAGGQYNRFNAYTIDGANQQDRFNLNSSGSVPGGAGGNKLISQDAVKEFRVMFTPTDVRQGNFTGMLVNAVTKSGTNELTGGGTFAYRASDWGGPFEISAKDIRAQGLDIKQYGFNLGGPIIKDKLHFFVAPEWQKRESPAGGPFVGATEAARIPTIAADSIARIIQIAQGHGIDAGTTGLIANENPLTNLFGRLDFQINQTHRLVARQIWNKGESDSFTRNFNNFNVSANVQNSGFRLTSNAFTGESKNASSVVQLYSNLSNGWQNELLVGYNYLQDERIVPNRLPEIAVGVTAGTATGVVTLGTDQFSPGNLLRQKIFEVANNLSIPMGVHTLTFGARFENDNIFNNFAQRSFGVWTFRNMADFEAGAAAGYTFGFSNSGNQEDIAARFSAQMYSVYGQDQWTVNDKLTVTAGLRADIPRLVDKPLENDTIAKYFSTLGLHTSDAPKTQVLFSPRAGFNYDISGNRTTQVRGNLGVYTGPPPFILIGNAYANHGLGLVTLICSAAGTIPAFTPNVDNQPKACLGQTEPVPGQFGTAGVNHNDPDFKYPQSFAASAGFDTRLPGRTTLTIEGLYRKSINGVFVRDLNLIARTAGGQPYTDRDGRVLYGDTIIPTATGASWIICEPGDARALCLNNNQGTRVLTTLRGGSFGEGMIDVTNQSKDYNYTLSARLSRQFGSSVELSAGYTYMQSKDVQSLTSDRAISNFRNGRVIETSHEDMKTTTSYFERPHRVVASGSYTFPWKLTTLSLYFEGISGTPYSYVANGDLNGDLSTTNDAIYIPRDATDPNEIRIGTGSGAAFVLDPAEAQAFENFIRQHDCLKDQRGKLMERNSCTSPFQKRMDASLRQRLPEFRGQKLALQVDVFNLPNLLNEDWGKLELPQLNANFPQQAVLRVQGRTPGPLNQAMTNYSFDLNATQRAEGPFRKQTGTANYWQMQMTVKYSL